MQPPDVLALRQAVLAVSVLDDIDVVPGDRGVLLPRPPAISVSWGQLRVALGAADPLGEVARARLCGLLLGCGLRTGRTVDELRALARPVALPADHVLHPGRAWVRHHIHGGALELGFGFLGVGRDPDEVVVIPPAALGAAGLDPSPWWPLALHYLEETGAVAGNLLRSGPVLRPVGDCDVVTLLAARSFRAVLCAAPENRMRAAAVPMRRRGWLNPSRIDPAFTAAAAAATAPIERAFSRPVLLTLDEVALPPAGGQPAEIVLRDPAISRPLGRRA